MRVKPTVGQKLFSLNIGNNARNKPQVLTPVIVTKVGRKYFTVTPETEVNSGRKWLAMEYYLEDWREHTEYLGHSCLYTSEQEWLDEKESLEIKTMLRETFSSYGTVQFSLHQLRLIKEIIDYP